MQRVLVIGCSGAGKSTFARKLSALTGLPLYHLDLLWHLPDRTHISQEEFDAKLSVLLSLDKWIIDGNYGRTLEARLKRCDTVFLLDYPLEVCLAGVEARVGKPRADMPWIEEEFDQEFKHWILDFPNEELPRIFALLERYGQDRQIVIFRSREDAERYLKEMEMGSA